MGNKGRRQQFWMKLLMIVLDIVAVNAAYYIALYARLFGYDNISELFQQKLNVWRQFTPIYTVVCIIVFAVFGLYNGVWKYAGMHDFNRILVASFSTSVIHTVGTWVFLERMPWTYYILGAFIQFGFICAIRLGYRIFLMEKAKIVRHLSPAENVMIIGSGPIAKRVMEYLENDRTRNLRPICIIDDEHGMSGISMNSVPIIGGTDRIEYGIERYKISNIYIANPFLDNETRNKIKQISEERYLTVRDYAGYLMSMDNDESMLDIVNVPTEINVKGVGKRIIPFSPPDISEKEIGEVTEALRSGWITTGPRTKLLERRLAAYIETGDTTIDCNTDENIARYSNRLVCLNSATAAEELNLRILGVGPGDEVIVPAYTYTASAAAAIHCGAKVVFVDIQKDGDPVTHMPEMDYDAMERAITGKTKAIVTVDLGGIVCDYDRIFGIVEKKRGLYRPMDDHTDPLKDLGSRIQQGLGRVAVVADCAHSLGASRVVACTGKGKGDPGKRYCGAIADFSSFSFHAVKNFTTAEGGASTWCLPETVYNVGVTDALIYKMYQLLSLHGQNKDALAKTKVGAWEYDIIGPWYKCNMTDIMAAIGLRQLDRYLGLLDRRVEMMAKYNATCDELEISHMVHHIDGMDSSNHLYLIRIPGIDVEERNLIIEKMAERGVATNVHYKPMPMMTAYKKSSGGIELYPNAYDYYKNLITLPFHTLLSDEDVEYVCETLKEVVSEVR